MCKVKTGHCMRVRRASESKRPSNYEPTPHIGIEVDLASPTPTVSPVTNSSSTERAMVSRQHKTQQLTIRESVWVSAVCNQWNPDNGGGDI